MKMAFGCEPLFDRAEDCYGEIMRAIKFTPLVLILCLSRVLGDQVEMSNGDRYNGNVLSVSASEVRLDNEINGLMKLSRYKVRAIFFGTNVLTHAVVLPHAQTNAPVAGDPLAEIKNGKIDPKTLQQVQTDILGTAGPEAKAMFNDLLKGLMTGTLSAEDVRRQAIRTVNELRSLQKEAGEGEDTILASYLGVLQKFIDEGSQTPNPITNSPPRTP